MLLNPFIQEIYDCNTMPKRSQQHFTASVHLVVMFFTDTSPAHAHISTFCHIGHFVLLDYN